MSPPIIEMVLCDRNITELRDILNRKAPKFLPDAEVLFAEMSYELIPAVDHAEKLIRDAKDQPILNTAIVSDVDIILTGDKDFLCLNMEPPKCMTVAQFFESEGNVIESLPAEAGVIQSHYPQCSVLTRTKVLLF